MEKEWNNEHGMNRRILVLQVWLLFIIGGHWVVALLP